MNLLLDEKGKPSTARALIVAAFVFQSCYLAARHEVAGEVIDFFRAIDLALIGWAAGPRWLEHVAKFAKPPEAK